MTLIIINALFLLKNKRYYNTYSSEKGEQINFLFDIADDISS